MIASDIVYIPAGTRAIIKSRNCSIMIQKPIIALLINDWVSFNKELCMVNAKEYGDFFVSKKNIYTIEE